MSNSPYRHQAVTIDDAVIDSLRRLYLNTGKSLMYYPTIRLCILRNYSVRYPVMDIDLALKDALNRLCHLRVGGIRRSHYSSYELLRSEEENSINWRLCSDSKDLKPIEFSRSPGFIVKKYDDLRGAYAQEKERQEAIALDKKNKETHSVYYIQWENDQQFVKIGYSKAPAKRIVGFLTANPNKLILLRVESVESRLDESVRHDYFAKYHHIREWFHYQGELKEYIQQVDCDLAISIADQIPDSVKTNIIVQYF
jgi:hypothetical protein